jgi:hypothetical protein
MITALQTNYLSWDLGSSVSYQAGMVLPLTLGFTAPYAGDYYLLGALFDANLDYIDGTLFGLLVPEGAETAVNDPQYTSIWELTQAESVSLGCQLTLDRTGVVLGLFLVQMSGEAPSLADDLEAGALSAELVAPSAGNDFGQVLSAMAPVLMLGMVLPLAFGDEEA